ncbi:MAG TPA: CHASE3 domain-containing protein, partial [Lysobacter sp.]
MPTSTRLAKFRTPTLALALILLAGVGIASVWGIVQFSRSAQWVAHSYEVLAKNEEIDAAVRTAESAARAYRLTGAPAQHGE